LPLVKTEEGISIREARLTDEGLSDPIRRTLHDEMKNRVQDLLRISGNQDEVIYRESCRLSAFLEPDLSSLDPLRIHLSIEFLRRRLALLGKALDADLASALAAVVEAGPGLTLNTMEVDLFIDRQRKNRDARLEAAEVEAVIRLTDQIGASDLSSADLKSLANAAAMQDVDDQLTGIRPTLTRNYVIFLGTHALLWTSQGIAGNAGYEAIKWLTTNSADIAIMASYWGEPFVAWILPIIDRAKCLGVGTHHATAHVLKALGREK
jgi:hypothetical protein